MTLFGVQLFAGALTFVRIAALVMLLPGFGEPAVPVRLRLAIALTLTLALAPTLSDGLPPEPQNLGAAIGLTAGEVATGLAIGAIARMLQSALSIAGQIAGFEAGLSFAQTQDFTLNQGGQLLGVFYSLLGVTLLFATNLHHELLSAIAKSYALFPPGAALPSGDFADWAVGAGAEAFGLGARIAAPIIFVGVLFRMGSAILARLAPQVQVFFVALPLNVALGLAAAAVSLSAGMLIWLDRMREFALDLR